MHFANFRMIYISINTLEEMKPVLFTRQRETVRIEFSLELLHEEIMTDGFRIKKERALRSITYTNPELWLPRCI